MKPLTVIAKLVAKPGREEDLATALAALVAPTRAEAGCINYDLHRSHEQPGTFMFTEAWATKDAWEQHRNSPHLQAFSARQGELSESWDVFVGEVM